jgi:hypothetical protein
MRKNPDVAVIHQQSVARPWKSCVIWLSNYIASHALYALSSKPGHRDRVASVRSRYLEVGRFRSETEQLNGRTLSLLVAELRLEKITGPMHR